MKCIWIEIYNHSHYIASFVLKYGMAWFFCQYVHIYTHRWSLHWYKNRDAWIYVQHIYNPNEEINNKINTSFNDWSNESYQDLVFVSWVLILSEISADKIWCKHTLIGCQVKVEAQTQTEIRPARHLVMAGEYKIRNAVITSYKLRTHILLV